MESFKPTDRDSVIAEVAWQRLGESGSFEKVAGVAIQKVTGGLSPEHERVMILTEDYSNCTNVSGYVSGLMANLDQKTATVFRAPENFDASRLINPSLEISGNGAVFPQQVEHRETSFSQFCHRLLAA
jgi:hypothetical protein